MKPSKRLTMQIRVEPVSKRGSDPARDLARVPGYTRYAEDTQFFGGWACNPCVSRAKGRAKITILRAQLVRAWEVLTKAPNSTHLTTLPYARHHKHRKCSFLVTYVNK